MHKQNDEGLAAEVRALIAEGNNLHAIARYRQATGKSLLESKWAVDNIQNGLPPDTPQPPPWRPSVRVSSEVRARLESKLPEGWTLARMRDIEPGADLLDPGHHRVVLMEAVGQSKELFPEVIINFDGQVLLREPRDPDWVMGQIRPDGSIVCHGYYTNDLARAIRAL